MTLQEISKTIDVIMESNKQAREQNNYIKLIENGFECLGFINKLINIAIDSEKFYRKLEASTLLELKSQGNKGKNGEAEVVAKASQYYSDWQNAKMLIDLCYEMNNVSKKLADSLNNELRQMRNN